MSDNGTLPTLSDGTLPAIGSGTSGALTNASTLAISISSSINVASIKTHVLVILSFKAANYTKWSMYFQADMCVCTWLYGSIIDDVVDATIEPNQTTQEFWLRVGALFTANDNTCAIYLRQQFHSLV
ncbi:uncharacterized protein LOC133914842 [Phragmites australis]|uniref:uncharacterized protein LOC133914842 n=1 Tax=Phragmites australis TaxID=29695 RepID=UPI002D778062|nr:uncharacterized protein LOC133914842 [Phragmites australis]